MEGKSPGFITPKKPTLSASARKIKDNAADWHHLMLKWEALNDGVFTTASKLVNLKISAQNNKMLIDETSQQNENLEIEREELESLCSELLGCLENLEKIQVKMEKLSSTLKGVCDLEEYHYRGEPMKPVHFHTWPTINFYETSLKMSEMYKKEMSLKRAIVGGIAHTSDQDLLLVYLSSWLYQPYIDHNIKVLLEGMLLETGHRPV
ncbi:cyclin-dependent kinase 2-interacting protein [Discoglossus pictus]